jgi:hypothetical protein
MGCPFYGKSGVANHVLIDTGGNQCALILESHTPCMMEVILNQEPDWETCPLIQKIERYVWMLEYLPADRKTGADWLDQETKRKAAKHK